jgi:hypothetical protein
VHFMRFKNSLAAAVAAAVSAVVFSAAFQPVEAALITIDNFTQATGTSSDSGSTQAVSAALDTSISGPFDSRYGYSASGVYEPVFSSRTHFVSVGSGVGTLSYTVSGTALGSGVEIGTGFSYADSGQADVNLLALTAGDFEGFVIQTGPNITLPANAYSRVAVASDAGANYGVFDFPKWVPNQTYYIPFSSFIGSPDPINFAAVSYFVVGFDVPLPGVPGTVASSGQVEFTLVAVPEPTHMVSVAGVGAALGAWRLRKLRRSRTAAGDAIAG